MENDQSKDKESAIAPISIENRTDVSRLLRCLTICQEILPLRMLNA